MNVNGGLDTQNLFTFNGGIFINPSRNTGMNYPPPDALQQFSIQTASFSRRIRPQCRISGQRGFQVRHQ